MARKTTELDATFNTSIPRKNTDMTTSYVSRWNTGLNPKAGKTRIDMDTATTGIGTGNGVEVVVVASRAMVEEVTQLPSINVVVDTTTMTTMTTMITATVIGIASEDEGRSSIMVETRSL